MLIGIIADSHDDEAMAAAAVELLVGHGAETLIHCGDLASGRIVEICARLPLYFVLGNHDADRVPELNSAAMAFGATCLDWGGVVELAGKRIAVAHGHMTMDIRPLLDAEPDYLLTGHTHIQNESWHGRTHRICPGALFRTSQPSVALLDTEADKVEFLDVNC